MNLEQKKRLPTQKYMNKSNYMLLHFRKHGLSRGDRVGYYISNRKEALFAMLAAISIGATWGGPLPTYGCRAFLAQLRDLVLHLNLKAGDVAYAHAPVGWAVWDYMITNLAIGVKLFLFDGGLDCCKEGYTVWDNISANNISFAFLSPYYLDYFEKENIIPRPGTNLDCLKIIALTGSPIRPQNYKFLLNNVKKDLFILSLYGILNLSGNSVCGKRGEIIVTKPNPAFPICLWKDDDNSKLNEEYFSKYKGVWCQNDEG
ncbi:acetoacetyl-CoA synthetase [Caerostris extrusa]|uniref:Acetoacetyl-CoA synthetase n=1 Tax=Caerostris extrusa TaxID=172846 RepID=A0AAV4S049_CAEEX|nr:acetoacetyl-CoA synthetase [Caerostris extrusa]